MKFNKNIVLLLIASAPIVLLASATTDRKIEDAAKTSYNFRTVLTGQDNVKVTSLDGVVTLSGVVQDKDDKSLAEDTVTNLSGVVRVENHIAVASPAPEHSDAWIALKIRSRLLVQANVSAANTRVMVKDGVVTLTGTTVNLAQKELTEIYVKEIDNVKSVKNELIVKAPTAGEQTMSEIIDDASITTQVKYALVTHRSTSARTTAVTTKEGAVMISGEAGSAAEKALVSKLAQDVRGVKSVTNTMTVKS